jgi:PelA/Pel-15E family pectate lyase
MELYNDKKNYSDKNLNNLLFEDLTVVFELKIFVEIENNYKLFDKGEKGEIFMILSKDNKIVVYYGNKIKRQIESKRLELNKTYHVTFIRSLMSEKNYIYIDGKINNVSPIQNKNGIELTKNKIQFLYGGVDYKLDKIKIYNYSMTLKNVKMNHLLDSKNKSGILKFISNRMDEIMEVNTGICSGFLLDDALILFTKCQMFMTQKNYPLDTYIKYNMEQHEFNIPQILTMMILRNTEIQEKFNMEDMAHNITTWQVGMYEELYSKNIPLKTSGYWIEKEVSPFVPFTGKGLTYVSADGKIIENKGTFQSGICVSFMRILIDTFLKTKNNILLISIHKLLDNMIEISEIYHHGGIPLYYPKLDNEDWKYNISIKNGNYINFLRTIEIILNNENLIEFIEPKLEKIKLAYKKTLNLLLKLQINVNGITTIWSQYYDKSSLSPCAGNSNEPLGLCSMESAQILLYLMDFENPTNNIKNSIISGCEWFKKNKICGWIQVFDKKSYDTNIQDELCEQQTMLVQYNYVPFPDKMTMHSRYYDFETGKPIFMENNEIYHMENFNDMSIEFRNSEFHIGMFGHYLLEVYDEWKIINAVI